MAQMGQSFQEILVAGLVKEEVTRIEKIFISSVSDQIARLELRIRAVEDVTDRTLQLLIEINRMMRNGQKVTLAYNQDNNITNATNGSPFSPTNSTAAVNWFS